MDNHPGPALVDERGVVEMRVELTEAIQLITRAQSIIEAEARMAEGYDRLFLEDVDDKLSDAIQTLEDM